MCSVTQFDGACERRACDDNDRRPCETRDARRDGWFSDRAPALWTLWTLLAVRAVAPITLSDIISNMTP